MNVPTEDRSTPRIDVVVPVYNEEKILPQSIGTLVVFLRERVEPPWRVLITDNASIDGTEAVSRELSAKYPEVDYVRIPRKGRGGALKQVWLEGRAEYVTYMDVDLSTNLDAFPRMIALLEGGSDVVIGSRLRSDADTTRSFKREFLSRGYNFLVKAFFGTRFSDAQCGFKGVRRAAADALVPHIADRKWFFDTELLVLAEKAGFEVAEVPVDWIEDLDTRVDLAVTIWDDLTALVRLRRTLGSVVGKIRRGDSPAK